MKGRKGGGGEAFIISKRVHCNKTSSESFVRASVVTEPHLDRASWAAFNAAKTDHGPVLETRSVRTWEIRVQAPQKNRVKGTDFIAVNAIPLVAMFLPRSPSENED